MNLFNNGIKQYTSLQSIETFPTRQTTYVKALREQSHTCDRVAMLQLEIFYQRI